MNLIIVHELGHFLTAKMLRWKTDKIELYPYGGISKFQTFVNVPVNQELLVLLMGPIAQIVFVYGCSFFLSRRNIDIMRQYHTFLLWFNLLPIYPLDGGRLIHLLCSKYIAFQRSFRIIVWITYMTILLVEVKACLSQSIFFICVLGLLALKIEKEREKFPYIFHKFLLERTLYSWNFKRKIIISEKRQMRRDAYHFFKKGDKFVKEEEYLKDFVSS